MCNALPASVPLRFINILFYFNGLAIMYVQTLSGLSLTRSIWVQKFEILIWLFFPITSLFSKRTISVCCFCCFFYKFNSRSSFLLSSLVMFVVTCVLQEYLLTNWGWDVSKIGSSSQAMNCFTYIFFLLEMIIGEENTFNTMNHYIYCMGTRSSHFHFDSSFIVIWFNIPLSSDLPSNGIWCAVTLGKLVCFVCLRQSRKWLR